jgi:hypothetical protein
MYEMDAIRKVMLSIHHGLGLFKSVAILFQRIHSVSFFCPKACQSLQKDYLPKVTFVLVQ